MTESKDKRPEELSKTAKGQEAPMVITPRALARLIGRIAGSLRRPRA